MNNKRGYHIYAKDKITKESFWGLKTPIRLKNGKTALPYNFDNAATTPPLISVIKEINNKMLYYGSIGRGSGQKSAFTSRVYENGRMDIMDYFNADKENYTLFYVNNTTDGINKLSLSLLEGNDDIVVSTRMEHHANDLPYKKRAKTLYAGVDEKGRLMVEDIERILKEQNNKTKYVAVTAVSNVTGYVNDVHKIAKIAHNYGAKIIVDGAQITAHRKLGILGETPEENIDFFVFSAHKMYSPYGGGGVIGLRDVLNSHAPGFYGGGMTKGVCDDDAAVHNAPEGYEAGSPNYAGVVGLIEAVRALKNTGLDNIKAHEEILLKKTIDGLKKMPGIILYGDCDNITDRLGIVPFNIIGMEPKTVADILSGKYGIFVRSGAFCAHPYVRRLTNDKETGLCSAPRGMVRLSYGIYNDTGDVDYLLNALNEIAPRV